MSVQLPPHLPKAKRRRLAAPALSALVIFWGMALMPLAGALQCPSAAWAAAATSATQERPQAAAVPTAQTAPQTAPKEHPVPTSSLHPQDDAALRALRAAFTIPPERWDANTPTDKWPRLKFEEIDGSLRVVALEIVATGRLSPAIGQLTHLREITTWCADLEGPLPEELGNLKELKTLKLTDLPRLGESLPDSICDLESLERLELRNLPIRALPHNLGKLQRLEILSVSHCPITAVPESIGNASRLEQLWLFDCLIDKLPESVGGLQRLQFLELAKNRLEEVPAFIPKLQSLFSLSLSYNRIKGPIPDSIFGPNLKWLELDNNQFSGPVPTALCNSPISKLHLANNAFTGPVPDCLAKLQLHSVDDFDKKLEVNAELAEKLQTLRFYKEHPFLRYRVEPEEDDSSADGPQISLYGVTQPFKLKNGYNRDEWNSTIRRSALWGEVQEFYLELNLPQAMDAGELKELLPKLLPQMDQAMRKAEAVPLAAMHEGVAELIYDRMREEVDLNNKGNGPENQIHLPPRERFGEVLWATSVSPVFTLREDRVLEHEIHIGFSTFEHYLGDIGIVAIIVDGKVVSVGLQ